MRKKVRSKVESGIAARALALMVAGLLAVACTGDSQNFQTSSVSSCMKCHNGSPLENYAGPGIENPHPFGVTDMACTTCHGGNGAGKDKLASHVPPPPEIGDAEYLEQNRQAYFNRLTLTGIDKFADYTVDGQTYSAIDYLQFINPGDLRVVTQSRSCGQCHSGHADCVDGSLLATSAGILSGAMFAIGAQNAVPENVGLHEDTAADLAFRAVTDPAYVPDPTKVGSIGRLLEFPVFSVFKQEGGQNIYNNQAYTAANLATNVNPADNTVVTGSPLANLYHEQVAFTCGDCHLGSAGANNRYGDFRSSGCTSCHMQYSLDGRSGTGDPNVNPLEPADPDDIRAPETSHPRRHLIANIAKTLPSGEAVAGINDYACAGCHQGSNRTVMQYWGIRLDQNQDLRRGVQYPADPVSFTNTRDDTRLFDPVVNNRTFNGRNFNQYILHEDYDGDGRDDTPPDVHYEAGLGCIDCHGSFDLHGGDVNAGKSLLSRQEQGVAIRCESCHGTGSAYAATAQGVGYDGQTKELAVDSKGNVLRHVEKEPGGYFLTSRLTGKRHYVSQTHDVVVDNGVQNPFTQQPVYSVKASYAMGRDDGQASTGIGPHQNNRPAAGFAHADSMDCASCHASWTNTCVGCHLGGEYDTGNNFSNITGEHIVFEQADADFVYQSPVPFQLGVGPAGKITPIAPNTETFFQYRDLNDQDSQIFTFSDRKGAGNNPSISAFPALSHNAMMPHSIRGRVNPTDEGPRYCVACHLTDEGLTNFGTEYDTLLSAMASNNFAALDFPLLQEHIGKNPGNQLNSPLWVHMVAGLGSGLFLFDKDGCAVNPLDDDDNRVGCNRTAPANNFNLANVAFNLDRMVEASGVSNSSSNHPFLSVGQGSVLRTGATLLNMSGPLGSNVIQRLTDRNAGIVLDAWLDADGMPQGNAGPILQIP